MDPSLLVSVDALDAIAQEGLMNAPPILIADEEIERECR